MTSLFCKTLLYCYIFTLGMWGKTPAKIAFHPLHVSTSDISYNPQDGKMEVTCTIFTDDFENALDKQYHTKIDLVKTEMHTAMDALVKRYVSLNLHLHTNNGGIPLNYVGFEVDRESVNVYLESEKTPAPKRIDAQVTLLHNLFTDQINIVHMTVDGVRKSGKLDYPDVMIGQSF